MRFKKSLNKTKYMVIKAAKKKKMCIRTSKSRKHSKNQEIQTLRNHNKWRDKSKWTPWRKKQKCEVIRREMEEWKNQ